MQLLKKSNWGEALLWLGFGLSALIALQENPEDNAPTIAGIFVLALNGNRVTRRVDPMGDKDAE
jgi:hypothetical protein